jgi:hypothetical protein
MGRPSQGGLLPTVPPASEPRQFRRRHGHGKCLMLTAYLSESEPSTVGNYMAVAGFYGNDAQWNALIPEWKQALGRRRSLRMQTLRIHSKPQRAKRLLDALAPIPGRNGLKPLCSLVRVADYVDLIQDGTPAMQRLVGYIVCLSRILIALNHTIPAHESINVVCEIQKYYETEVARMFRVVTRGMADPGKPYFSGIEFVHKNCSVLTQPADLLAFAARHCYEDKKSGVSTLCRPILGNRAGYEISRPLARDIVNLGIGAPASVRRLTLRGPGLGLAERQNQGFHGRLDFGGPRLESIAELEAWSDSELGEHFVAETQP